MADPRPVLNPSINDLDLIVRAAWLYHEDGMTQAQVARRLYVSRQTVGRLLDEAREKGIVRVEIDARYLSALDLATRLRDALGLADAVVVPDIDGGSQVPRSRTNERVAAALAAYVRRYLHPGAVVGIGWGDTVARSLSMLSDESLTDVTLASAAGSIQAISESLAGNPLVARRLRVVPAPLVVSSATAAEALRSEASVRDVLDLAAGANVLLTSIGSAQAGASAVRSGVLTEDDVAGFRDLGAVGDMLGEWYDAHGRVIAGATHERRIGLELDRVREMPNVVVVAGGADKAAAIRGAIAGGYVKVLVTDEPTAKLLLR